jgi:chromosome segregation ATPase
MHRLTVVGSPPLLVLAFIACTPSAAVAQQTETDLLRSIACEIRELRSVVQQGQILVPLLEANRREREYASQQLAAAEEQLRQAHAKIESWVRAQQSARNGLQELKRAGRLDLDSKQAAQKQEFEEVLKNADVEIERFQSEEGRLVSESGQIRARLSRLEDEFDRTQRQMQAMATSTGSVCDSSRQAAN